VGVYGAAGAGGLAGYFEGNVYVTGTVTQGGADAAGAASLSEDVGGGTLANGKATIVLDKQLASTLDGDYRVFVTAEGDSNGLFVSRKGRDGFDVQEQRSGTSNLAFSYRVVRSRGGSPERNGAQSGRPALGDRKDVQPPSPPPPPEAGQRDTRNAPKATGRSVPTES